jgi:small subunit ribosomal protein S9
VKKCFLKESSHMAKSKTGITKSVPSKKSAPLAHTVGRRKAAVARVWLRNGAGSIKINGKDYLEYFDTEVTRINAAKPFQIVPAGKNYDVEALVAGGGKGGQAGAVNLGISRALLALDEGVRTTLRLHNLLTVDSRQKERKKYGQRAARRKFQFVKR